MLTSSVSAPVDSDRDYSELERLISWRVAAVSGPLFTTNAEGLFEAYLAGIPAESRQHYTCRCCRRFVERYGGLVSIEADGRKRPLLWEPLDVPGFFQMVATRIWTTIGKAKVDGVFINGDKVWGTPFNVPGKGSKFEGGRWTHLHGFAPSVFSSPLKTADQEMAEKKQDYITLHRGLAEIPLEAVVQAVRVLEADAVDRSEKTHGLAKWLLALHQSIADLRGPSRDNLIWLAVAKAPPGWCHVRSTMIATLLDDVVQGVPFDAIKRRWNEKMHPLQYQRPSAPPKAGNIEQANKIVAKLQSEGALARRFATLAEVVALWKPREIPPPKAGGGAFDHLKASKSKIKEVELPAQPMVWEKFRDTILPTALEVEVHLPYGQLPMFGMVTAVNPDAPPLLQWDGLEGLPRNPVSWYFWNGGSSAASFGLDTGWHKTSAVCLKPCHWQSDKFVHQGPGVFFIIEAARDSRMADSALFPETLRNEYHGIRSVMEANSRGAGIEGKEAGNANGIALQSGMRLTVRVKAKDGAASYSLSL